MIIHKLEEAIAKRAPILGEGTDALRLLDADGDGLPGLYLDTFAERWLVSTQGNQLGPEYTALLKEQGRQGRSIYWKQLDQNEKTNPTHIAGPPQDEAFMIKESGVNYKLSFQSGYSQGIFLDQRLNRRRVRDQSQAGMTVLNTFAYTGAFSVCAALGGATTTTLDLSQVYLDWARNHFTINGLDAEDHFFCKGDTFHWLKRFARQGRTFDGIILDPPTFSRDDKGKVFRVEKDYGRLVSLAHTCLAEGGWVLCCTNCRKLDLLDFTRMIRKAMPRARLTTLPMPEEYTAAPYLKSIWVTA
ncbi:MAG: class I SAM-dependent rRNA methyltransferase [Akkermansiaceae bacterium]